MEKVLICSFLSRDVELFVTSHSTIRCCGNFSTSFPVGVIIIYDANSSVIVLKMMDEESREIDVEVRQSGRQRGNYQRRHVSKDA